MSPFVKQERKTKPGFNIGTILNKKVTKGDIGIEIEVEGARLPHESSTPAPWVYHMDGSLRGEDNAEYVLAKPIKFSEVGDALSKLWGAFETKKSRLDDSNRTSVHIHLNCQEFHLNRLTSFMALWFTLEEILTAWCGEHRVGNLFCLRAKDAPAIIGQLRRFIKMDGASPLSENLHYAGLNAHALHKFGSLEIRTLRGCSDPQTILDWVGMIERLYVLSESYDDPRDICSLFSAEGPLMFFETLLGDKAPVVRAGIGYTDDQIRDAMYTGVRLAQDLCYCRDWDQFKAMTLKDDPFGRSMKTVVKKLQAASGPVTGFTDDYFEPDPEPEYDPDPSGLLVQQAFAAQAQTSVPSGSSAPPIPVWATTPNPFAGGSNG